jgi:YkoY family integral membrane protein
LLPDWFHWSDLITILALVGLEGILSGDNALVLAVLVQRLPNEADQRRALRYGIIGAFVLRGIATILARHLLDAGAIVALLGGLYLCWLPYKHFASHADEAETEEEQARRNGRRHWLGLSAFWATVLSVELTDLVFAGDSIRVAIAMSDKLWVIMSGGILGIIMMRLLTVQVLALIKRYPRLIDGAYIIVAWVGIKLLWEFAHKMHWVPWMLPKVISIGMVIVLFIVSYLYARAHPAERHELTESAEDYEDLMAPERRDEPDAVAGPVGPAP